MHGRPALLPDPSLPPAAKFPSQAFETGPEKASSDNPGSLDRAGGRWPRQVHAKPPASRSPAEPPCWAPAKLWPANTLLDQGKRMGVNLASRKSSREEESLSGTTGGLNCAVGSHGEGGLVWRFRVGFFCFFLKTREPSGWWCGVLSAGTRTDRAWQGAGCAGEALWWCRAQPCIYQTLCELRSERDGALPFPAQSRGACAGSACRAAAPLGAMPVLRYPATVPLFLTLG